MSSIVGVSVVNNIYILVISNPYREIFVRIIYEGLMSKIIRKEKGNDIKMGG